MREQTKGVCQDRILHGGTIIRLDTIPSKLHAHTKVLYACAEIDTARHYSAFFNAQIEVTTIHRTQDIIDACSSLKFDIIVLNSNDLDEYGPLVISRIRAHFSDPNDLFIVAVGPFQFPEFRSQLERAGADLVCETLPRNFAGLREYIRRLPPYSAF